MKHSRVKARGRTQAGFSLIEIMLALAIIAIGLIAIIGLIPQGVQASRGAADNTLSATVAHDVFNTIRSKPFATVDLTSLGFTNAILTPFTILGTPGIYNLQNAGAGVAYYDQKGYTPPATPQDNYYAVCVTFTPQPGLSLVRVMVTWPVKSLVSVAAANTNIYFTQVANYQ